MTNFLIVSGADFESVSVFESLGGRSHGHRMGIVPWWGTAEQLGRRLAALLPRIVAIVSLDGDCFVGQVAD
jgi:hypothetical protein